MRALQTGDPAIAILQAESATEEAQRNSFTIQSPDPRKLILGRNSHGLIFSISNLPQTQPECGVMRQFYFCAVNVLKL